MDLVRTLGVAIDPSAAKSGGTQASSAFKGVGEAAKGMEKSVQGAQKQMKDTSTAAGGLSSALGFLKAALAAAGAAALIRELYQTTTAVQRFQNQLKFASSGAEDFKRNFDFVRGTAKQLGMEMLSAGNSFGAFAAAAKGKMSGGQIRDTFLAVSEASTALGLSADQTSGALTALSQMLSKGTVSAEELRGQLGERLYGAFTLAAQAMGKTEKELGKALETGGIMADELLPRLALKLHETFGAASRDEAKSLASEMNRLKNEWTELQMVFMSSGGEALFTNVLKGAQSALESLKKWVAAMFEASAEGRLSEAVAASLRIGFGKAANYFGGFVVTAAEMMGGVGKGMFSNGYFETLVRVFQAVAASFGLAMLEAMQKPLAYVQAAMEKIFDGDNRKLERRASEQAAADVNRQFGVSSETGLTGIMLPVWAQNDATKSAVESYRAAIVKRTAQLEKQLGVVSIENRVDAIMASGGPRFGFSGSGETVAGLQSANQANLTEAIGHLSQLSSDIAAASAKKLKNFKPLDAVDTSADEEKVKGFLNRSSNTWAKDAPAPEFTNEKPKSRSLLDEFREGMKERAAVFTDMVRQMRAAGKETADALASNFTNFFTGMVTEGGSAIDRLRSMFASLAKDIATIFARRTIAEPLAGALSLALSGGFNFGSAGSDTANNSNYSGNWGVPRPSHHTGGIVGSGSALMRSVDPALFANAPRFHNGLAADEFPAILQRGEEVIPKNQVGKGGEAVNITVNVDGSKGGSPEGNQKLGAEIARQIEAVIDQRIARAAMPRGILRRA